MKTRILAAAVLALAALPAAAECTWEWLCNGDGNCKLMPVCDSVYDVPAAPPNSQPPAMPPLSMRPHRIPGADGRPHLRAHHAPGQERALVLERGLLLHRSAQGQGSERAVREHRALRQPLQVEIRHEARGARETRLYSCPVPRASFHPAPGEVLLDHFLVEARRASARSSGAGRPPATRSRTRTCRWWSPPPACGCARRSPRPSGPGHSAASSPCVDQPPGTGACAAGSTFTASIWMLMRTSSAMKSG